MRVLSLGIALTAAAGASGLIPAHAGAAVGAKGNWYGVSTHYEDISTHEWVAYTDPLADGINVRFVVARAKGSTPDHRRVVIKRLTVAPSMWPCSRLGTSIRIAPVLTNVKVTGTGRIPFTFSDRPIANPVLDPPVEVADWKPSLILALSGRFSATGFADGTMFMAVQGCGWFFNEVWIAIKPKPSEVSTLTTRPAPDEVPATPSQPDSDGEDWIGCHLLWCTPYSLPPFAPISIPNLG